ncbi:MAG TPA: serine hydrolase domain-containing protein, partial [Thermoanaerobaculia bacterium]|nr:serine hydrolase domain-containing protein [Thermoanaerobaculia bacterium]
MPGRDCPWPLAALLALLVTTMGTPAQALEASTAADLDGLLGRVAGILAREGVPGAGLALVDRGGTAWAGGVGTTEPGGGRAVDADTPFRVGSVSKTITAIAVMRLVEDRRLSLDATLAEAAPDVPFENPWEAGRPVRVAHLLEHTAGFEFCGFNEWFDDRPEPRTLLEALQVNPRSRRVRWPPGSRVSYSNEGYLAAGRILERATGLPFDAAVRDLALAPLGMTSSAFQAAPPLRARLAPGHGWPERPGVRVAYEDDMMRPAANLITTPRDASRLVSLFLGRGTLDGRAVLGPAAIDRMERRLTLPFAGPEEQFGIGLETFQAGGLLGFGHVGVTYGYEAAFRYLPSAGVGWAVLLNGAGSGPRRAREAIEAEILAFLSRGAPPPPVPRPAPASR